MKKQKKPRRPKAKGKAKDSWLEAFADGRFQKMLQEQREKFKPKKNWFQSKVDLIDEMSEMKKDPYLEGIMKKVKQ